MKEVQIKYIQLIVWHVKITFLLLEILSETLEFMILQDRLLTLDVTLLTNN